MALDTGGQPDLDFRTGVAIGPGPVESYMPTLKSGPDIGAALKAIRESRGLTLEELADATRVRRSYLAAIEEMRLDTLPSRPFTIGYIRAYAKALGQDGETAVVRFRAERPAGDEGLREPVGVSREGDPRVALIVVVGALIIGAIVLWNVVQRAMTENAQAQAHAPATAPRPKPAPRPTGPAGPVTLGAPLPAPTESTTPTPYETPGLAAATAANGSADAAAAAAKIAKENATPAPDPTLNLPPTFLAAGPIYGAAPEASTATLQARKAASLIVRGADGSVYFARQLSVGEAYRIPNLAGLVVDVSDPTAFQVFVGGQTQGLLQAPLTPVDKLAG